MTLSLQKQNSSPYTILFLFLKHAYIQLARIGCFFRTIGGVDEQNIFVKSRSCEIIIVIVRHSLLQRFLVDTRTEFQE